ncbi:MAG TPA: hypothetical protein DDX81_07585 [Desulfofustis sp.]|jgi:hypothetical protein|nr:hypothetical protein [Desulfofustis sp.]
MNLWVNQSTSQPCTKGKKMMIKNRKSMRFLAPLTLAAMICGTFSSVAFAQADGPVSQTVEGAGKIVTSPAEIPKGIGESTERNDPVTGTVSGTLEGTGEGVKQIGEGAEEIIEAPLQIGE